MRLTHWTTVGLAIVLLSCIDSQGAVESHQLNSAADLDLSGDIIYAINFGNNGQPWVGGIRFQREENYPAVTLNAPREQVMSNFGPGPNTGDAGLDTLLNGSGYRLGSGTVEMSVSAGGLEVGRQYLLQVVFYTANHAGGARGEMYVEGHRVFDNADPVVAQGGVLGQGGSVTKYDFIASDSVLNIRMVTHGGFVSGMNGFILTLLPDLDALHEGFRDALNTQDLDGVASYYHEDATWDYVALPPVHEGKEQIRTFYDEIFKGFPDFHVEHRNRLISEDILITECTVTATHLGEIFEIPGTGNPVQLMHMDIYEYEGDKIEHMTTYDDAASFLVQFGVMPDPGLDPAMLVPSFALPAAEPTGLAPVEAGLQLDALYDAHDLASYARNIHPDAEILLAPLGVPLNREQFIAALELYFLGFPDLNQEIVRSIDMGDGWAAFEVIYKGNNTGPYFGMPPTQRYSEVKGAWIAKFDADGLCTNMSAYFDNITVLANLGLFPPPDPEANKTLERRVFDEIWNQGLLDVADEVFAPDATLHLGADDVQGPEAFKAYVAGYRAAFPDIHWTVEDQIAEGEMVVTRLTGTGTHQGELMGIPPTGLPITVTAVATVRIAQGKIQESWNSWDALGLMQQLGVMPPSREDYTWGAPSEVTGDPGDPAANTAQVLYVVQKFWNEHIVAALDSTHNPDALAHNPVIPGHPLPYQMYKHVCLAHLAAFPDFYVTNENVIAEGDKVAVRWTVDGTHLGELMGMPPTGRPVTFTGSTIYRLADGRIVETWWCYDALGMMQQITGPYCASPIPGDVNDDCKVDCADLAIMGSHWLEDNSE